MRLSRVVLEQGHANGDQSEGPLCVQGDEIHLLCELRGYSELDLFVLFPVCEDKSDYIRVHKVTNQGEEAEGK